MSKETLSPRWRGLIKSGGISFLIIAVLLLAEGITYALLPRAETTLEQFDMFQDNWLYGLLTFDLLGMISYLFFIPAILALYLVLRRWHEGLSLVAAVLFFLGIADFYATNTIFSMFTLSQEYASATTEAERAMYLAAGHGLLTLFNESAFLVSYVIVSGSWLLISVVMLRGQVFSRLTAWSGILAGAAGILAVVLEHVSASAIVLNTAIGFYFAAIVFLFIWAILAGLRLYRLSKQVPVN